MLKNKCLYLFVIYSIIYNTINTVIFLKSLLKYRKWQTSNNYQFRNLNHGGVKQTTIPYIKSLSDIY